MGTKIVVATDGSEHAERAIEWCAEHAGALDAEVVVVHAMEPPRYTGVAPSYIWVRAASVEQQKARRNRVAGEWCVPLSAAGVPFRVEVVEGDPAEAVARVAREEAAALVVTGRRGLGPIRERLIGSTSHALMHSLNLPLVSVP
jgi:nucleotide-binding universal stress UspA family protein